METTTSSCYSSEVGERFIELRGYGLTLSPLDANLIEQWRDLGIPLRVVLGAVETVMGNLKGRRVRSLSYCQEEVEAQFAEWQEMRVGRNG
jgi:hypothetical protein